MVKVNGGKYTKNWLLAVGSGEVLDGTLFLNFHCPNNVKYVYIAL